MMSRYLSSQRLIISDVKVHELLSHGSAAGNDDDK